MADLPLTLRLNNPGAIEFGPFARQHGGQGGHRFATFPDLGAGFAAMDALLSSYRKRGLNTPAAIIGRWAPANVDNNSTSQYAATVAKRLGIGVNDPVPDAAWPQLAEAMAAFETGRPVPRPAAAPTATPTAAPTPARAPTATQTAPPGLLAAPGGQPMANGNNPMQGLLSDPLFNVGIGLLAASGPSTMPVSLGQALGQGAQFASQAQQAALRNDIQRQQLVEAQQQRQAQQALSERLPGLLGNLPPEQREAVGLLAQVAPGQVAQQLLGSILPQQTQTRPNSLIAQAQFAFPGDEKAQRQFVIERGGGGAMTDQLLKTLQVQQAQLSLQQATTKEERHKAEGKISVLSGVDRLREVADINNRLRGTLGETGLGFSDVRSAAAGPFSVLVGMFGGDEARARQVAADIGRLDQLTTNEAITSLFGGEVTAGTITDEKLRTFLATKPGLDQLPETNNKIIADMLQQKLNAAGTLGVSLEDRPALEALIKDLRGTGTSAQPKTEPGGEGAPDPQRRERLQAERDVLRRASERLGRPIEEKDIRDTMRQENKTRRQVIEELQRLVQ